MERPPTALAARDPRVDFGTSSPAAVQTLHHVPNWRKSRGRLSLDVSRWR